MSLWTIVLLTSFVSGLLLFILFVRQPYMQFPTSPCFSSRFPAKQASSCHGVLIPLVTLEEHWLAQFEIESQGANNARYDHDANSLVGILTPAVIEFGETQLKAMDGSPVALPIVSHAPHTLP